MTAHTNDDASGLTAAQAKWNPIPEERRTRWCQAQLDFPPVWFGVIPMVATADAVRAGTYTNITEWVQVAHDFEAAGFTPEQYYLLRLCIRHLLGEKEHHLLHRTVGNPGGPDCRFIKAEDWHTWLRLIDAGHTPLRATSRILTGPMSIPVE